jgi:hypothetical protein
MDWLTRAFEEHSIAWLIVSTVVALIAGFISSWLTYRFKSREIIDTAIADIEKQRNILRFETEKERQERIRLEIVKWANPILAAVRDLKSRLENILDKAGYLALSSEYKSQVNPNWSISYDYFMSSTFFVFAQHFAWVQMLQDELNFELFQSQQAQKEFFDAVHEVRSALGSFPPHHYECSGKDTQVFSLQQRAIGELLILREKDSWRCMSYPEFIERLNASGSILNQHLQPLRTLLDHLTPNDDCRWKRLDATRQALSKLETVCEKLLSLSEKS